MLSRFKTVLGLKETEGNQLRTSHLKASNFVPQIDVRGLLGTPLSSSPILTAYDPLQKLFAIGSGPEVPSSLIHLSPGSPLQYLLFQINQGRVICVQEDGCISVWKVDDGSMISRSPRSGQDKYTCLYNPPCAPILYIGTSSGVILLFRIDNGMFSESFTFGYRDALSDFPKVKSSGEPPSIVSMMSCPANDEEMLIVYSTGILVLLNVVKKERVVVFSSSSEGTPSPASPRSACWSPDGKDILCGFHDGRIILWHFSEKFRNTEELIPPKEVLGVAAGEGVRTPVVDIQWSQSKNDDFIFVHGGNISSGLEGNELQLSLIHGNFMQGKRRTTKIGYKGTQEDPVPAILRFQIMNSQLWVYERDNSISFALVDNSGALHVQTLLDKFTSVPIPTFFTYRNFTQFSTILQCSDRSVLRDLCGAARPREALTQYKCWPHNVTDLSSFGNVEDPYPREIYVTWRHTTAVLSMWLDQYPSSTPVLVNQIEFETIMSDEEPDGRKLTHLILRDYPIPFLMMVTERGVVYLLSVEGNVQLHKTDTLIYNQVVDEASGRKSFVLSRKPMRTTTNMKLISVMHFGSSIASISILPQWKKMSICDRDGFMSVFDFSLLFPPLENNPSPSPSVPRSNTLSPKFYSNKTFTNSPKGRNPPLNEQVIREALEEEKQRERERQRLAALQQQQQQMQGQGQMQTAQKEEKEGEDEMFSSFSEFGTGEERKRSDSREALRGEAQNIVPPPVPARPPREDPPVVTKIEPHGDKALLMDKQWTGDIPTSVCFGMVPSTSGLYQGMLVGTQHGALLGVHLQNWQINTLVEPKKAGASENIIFLEWISRQGEGMEEYSMRSADENNNGSFVLCGSPLALNLLYVSYGQKGEVVVKKLSKVQFKSPCKKVVYARHPNTGENYILALEGPQQLTCYSVQLELITNIQMLPDIYSDVSLSIGGHLIAQISPTCVYISYIVSAVEERVERRHSGPVVDTRRQYMKLYSSDVKQPIKPEYGSVMKKTLSIFNSKKATPTAVDYEQLFGKSRSTSNDRGTASDRTATQSSQSRADATRQEVQSTSNIMNRNIQALQERGEKLQQLSDKSEELNQGAGDFYNMAKEIRKREESKKWWELGGVAELLTQIRTESNTRLRRFRGNAFEAIFSTISSSIHTMKSLASYNIEKTLSKTSNREVFLATNKKGNKVVIKKINKLGVSEILIEGEIEAGHKLSHKRIVKYITEFEDGNYAYIVIDYIRGLDLFAILSVNNFEISMQEKEAKRIFRQLVNAVTYTHKQGFAHHDIKLENIMITEKDSSVRLIDYGLCEKINPGMLSRSYCGSHDYVSPEVLRRTPYCPFKADVWSLGTVLYIMLYAELPFGFQSRAEAISNGQPHPTVEFADHRNPYHTVSVEAKQLISMCLQGDADKRASLEEVANHKWLLKEKKQSTWMNFWSTKKTDAAVMNQEPSPSRTQAVVV
ncbi:NUAK family SNF1-like kinase 1-like [Planoprotostelium fungivorum]|uniref:non-specific serine/threonine protein kinase n=1 Tax=Planoprotostelium fungivorum TaxID=1890364 RepID=A0A2P6N2W9_9EUKA|nr:NUAK family SNF1-like kinase 1-like [Planoprotostelium fungivorum]